MTNEEFQRTVLEQLVSMNNRFDKLDGHMGNIEGRIDKLDSRMDKLEQRLEEESVKNAKRSDAVDRGFEDVIAMLTLMQEDIRRLDAKTDIVNERAFENEADIRLLKRIAR
jgi:prefoldin subunit 5